MSHFIVGLFAGYLAFITGKWRHACVIWETKAPHNLPSAWHNPAVRIGTWIAVTICSLVFATAIATVISKEINTLLGKFLWGVLLAARYYASGVAAIIQTTHELEKMEESQREAEK